MDNTVLAALDNGTGRIVATFRILSVNNTPYITSPYPMAPARSHGPPSELLVNSACTVVVTSNPYNGSTTGKLRLQRSLSWSIFSGAALAQVAAVSGFWPVSFMSSLFLAAILFIILGVLHLQEKKQTSQALLRQYLLLTGAVVFIYFIGTQW